MATNEDQRLFQCSTCQRDLDMDSKTLTCLHSFCGSCMNQELQGKTSGNGQCPECLEIFQIDQLTLSPVLINSLCQWKCDMCLEDGTDSIATNWCHDCVKFFCENCSRFHKRLPREKHNSVELDENGKEEVQKALQTDLCKIHNKIKESYCKRCNVCLCDTCYAKHLNDSPQCSSCPISVREEALQKEKSEGPTLIKEISDLEIDLRKRNEKYLSYSEELERECDSKCEDVWRNYEEILEKLREKMHEMCEELRRLKNEQVKKWHKLAGENERMLKKLEIWRINLCHLLEKDQNKKTDIVCGVELVGKKFASSSSSSSLGSQPEITEPVRKCELEVKFSSYYLEFLVELKNQIIGSASLNYSENTIHFENEWNLPGCYIQSIVVNPQDNHIFLSDARHPESIIELNESGQFISEFILYPSHSEDSGYMPGEMFFSSPEILLVIYQGYYNGIVQGCHLMFLEREKCPPYLKINKTINANLEGCSSVCQIKNTILMCNYAKLKIYFFTEKGEYLKTVDTGESVENFRTLIRADPTTENFWAAQKKKIFCFNDKAQKLKSFEIEEKVSGFSLNELGKIFFCNDNGIFTFFPEKGLHKTLHKFEKKCEKSFDENDKFMFVSREKIFVYYTIYGTGTFIKIFKFLE